MKVEIDKIIKEIRSAGAWTKGPYLGCNCKDFFRSQAQFMAADEIENLLRKLASCKEAMDKCRAFLDSTMSPGEYKDEVLRHFDVIFEE